MRYGQLYVHEGHSLYSIFFSYTVKDQLNIFAYFSTPEIIFKWQVVDIKSVRMLWKKNYKKNGNQVKKEKPSTKGLFVYLFIFFLDSFIIIFIVIIIIITIFTYLFISILTSTIHNSRLWRILRYLLKFTN